MLLPPLDRRRPVYRRERPPNEHLGALHCAADCHLPSHGALSSAGCRLQPLAVAALPTVDFPTLTVTASCPAPTRNHGSSVAQPLERQFAALPGVNQITSTSVRVRRSSRCNSTFPATSMARPPRAPRHQRRRGTCRRTFRPAHLQKGQPGRPSRAHPRSDLARHDATRLDQYADLNIAQRISAAGCRPGVIFGEQKYAPTVR